MFFNVLIELKKISALWLRLEKKERKILSNSSGRLTKNNKQNRKKRNECDTRV